MRIAIIGTGNVGRALGVGWSQKGHRVIFGSRDPQGEKVSDLLQSAGEHASAASIEEAVKQAEVVALALPWRVTSHAVQSIDDWQGKILIDCTNAIRAGLQPAIDPSTSAAQMVASWANGARVVKSFNSVGAEIMADPTYGEMSATMFICGDDEKAKATVSQLTADLGFEVIDAGSLSAARFLEMLALVWIHLANTKGLDRHIAFKLLQR